MDEKSIDIYSSKGVKRKLNEQDSKNIDAITDISFYGTGKYNVLDDRITCNIGFKTKKNGKSLTFENDEEESNDSFNIVR